MNKYAERIACRFYGLLPWSKLEKIGELMKIILFNI